MAVTAATAPYQLASPAVLPKRRRSHLPTVAVPRLSVVLVNYRQWDDTANLVRQLRTARCALRGEAEVVIVDNHSPIHPLMARLRRAPGVSLRRWGRNRGFARAVNEGCRLSRGEWFLLLNPDMTVPSGFLDGVLAVADRLTAEDPRAGIIGFQLRNADGSHQLSSGAFPTLLSTLAGLFVPRKRRKYRRVHGCHPRRVPWVTGCCLLVRRECFRQLGGFDRDFFLYYEDVDFCQRARARGWTVWHDPRLQAVHHRPLHMRTMPAHLRLIVRHALLTYADKHWPGWQRRFLAGVIRCEAWLRQIAARWCGNEPVAGLFGQLGCIAAGLAGGCRRTARRRLDRALRREEARLGP